MTSPGSLNAALSAAGHPWQAAENPMTRRSEDQRRYRLGVQLPDGAEQGGCGSCVATAALTRRRRRSH